MVSPTLTSLEGLYAHASRSPKGIFCPVLSQSVPTEVKLFTQSVYTIRSNYSRYLTFAAIQLSHDVCLVHLPEHSLLFAKVATKQVDSFTFSS